MEQLTSSSFKRSNHFEVSRMSHFEHMGSVKLTHRSSSIGSADLATFNKLQLKIGEFEDICFPPLSMPTTRRHMKKKKKRKEDTLKVKEPELTKVFVKFSMGANRKNVISESTDYVVHSEAIGPGKYETRSKFEVKGGNLSTLPRFNQGLMQAAEDFLNTKGRRLSESFIDKNLDLTQYNPSSKVAVLQEVKKLREFEGNVHLKTKASLDLQKHEELLGKYKAKMAKYEWRLKGENIQEVKETWAVTVSAFASAFAVKMMILSKIARNKRIKKNFILLSWLCRFVGKVGLRLKNYRWKMLIKAVDKRSKYIRLWINKRGRLYKNMIGSVVDKAFVGNYMTQFMGQFKKKVCFAQIGIRELMKIKKARNWALINLFNKVERQINQSRGGKRINKTNPQVSIDDEIRKFYNKIAKEHVEKMTEFRSEMTKYKEKMESNLDDKTLLESTENMEPPKRPKFILYTRNKDALKWVRGYLGLENSSRVSPLKKPIIRSPALRRQSMLR